MLKKAANHHGPLQKESLDLLRRYVQNPSPSADEWEQIAHLVISPDSIIRATVWQAVRMVDPEFPWKLPPRAKTAKQKWQRVPSGFTVALALRDALKENE